MMIELRDKDTGVALGTISDEQLDFLAELLEEGSSGDHDYYINLDTLEMLEKSGADQAEIVVLEEHREGDEAEGPHLARVHALGHASEHRRNPPGIRNALVGGLGHARRSLHEACASAPLQVCGA